MVRFHVEADKGMSAFIVHVIETELWLNYENDVLTEDFQISRYPFPIEPYHSRLNLYPPPNGVEQEISKILY